VDPKPERYFEGQRLLLRELISRQFQLQAVFTSDAFVTNKSMQSILPIADGPNIRYLLGILNSRLMSWYFLQRSTMVTLVERMLKLNKKKPGAKTPPETARLEREIAATDREIDQLVYELYGLTAEELKIVEEGAGTT
jgi:hypothetical protein